jgi:hypothetical protein
VARIRSIKPEILERKRTAALSHEAWRLFVSMITLADDYGNVNAEPRRLDGAVFWATPCIGIDLVLAELEAAGLVKFYESRGCRFAHLNGWEEHQRVDKPGPKKCDLPEDGQPITLIRESPGIARERLANRQESPGIISLGLDGIGGEGKGEEGSGEVAPAAPSPPAGLDLGEPENAKQKKMVDKHVTTALEILTQLNAARSRVRPSSRAIRPMYSSLGGIAARLASGRTLEECLLVVATGEAECGRKPECFDYFDAVSPWRPENFERRLSSDVGGSAGSSPKGGGLMRDAQLKIAARYGA